MDIPTKTKVLQFVDFQISKGLVNVNTGNARKASCNKILEAFSDEEDLSGVDIRSEILKFNNRHPGQLSPESLSTYEKRVSATLEEYKKWSSDPTRYKGVIGRPILSSGDKKDKKAKSELSDVVAADPPPAPIASKQSPTSAITETSLMMPFPLRPTFLAQIIIPRDLSKDEATRLCAFIQALATEQSKE